jgi:acyl transferase domain-containing protein
VPELTHIAVTGCSARFPGSIFSYEDLREVLLNGKSGITEVPTERWNAEARYNSDITQPGTINNKRGGFIKDIKGFDAGLFGISPAEAVSMDPQIRLSLELAFEAFEHAGYPLQKLKGTSTGVYIGSCFNDYRDLCYKDVQAGVTSHTITGNTNCCISGRVAYYFGLEGPALTVDTACSSSMVAVHYAIRDLLSGDTDRAIAGGVNLMITPENHMAFTSLNALSPDGTCYSFDARANGYVRSDGGAMLILKRLEDAVNDGDDILAVIASSQVNNDGYSKSFTAPNPKAQEKLIRKAIEKAGITPADIDYIEAHGPGTYVGDPIELNAISGVFDGEGRQQPLYVGSIKSNIGHTESASGVASLLKAILTVREQTIFPNLNFEQPNPRFDWASSAIKVPVDVIKTGRRMCVGVNSFGISGTNVHQIILPAPEPASKEKDSVQRSLPYLLPISAADDDMLKTRTAQLTAWLKEGNGHLPERVATLAKFHTHLPKRIVLMGDTADVLLQQAVAMPQQSHIYLPHATKVFLFSGQGGLWQGMGIQLLASFPVFALVFNECAAIAKDVAGIDLHAALASIPTGETERQALTFAYQLALAELWVSMGMMPDVVMGHSLGEIVAACFAGAIDRKTALQIVIARGRAINIVADTGTMWVAGISAEEFAEKYAADFVTIDIAAINGPETIVLSGTEDVLQQFGQLLDAEEVFNKRTQINYASHSRYIEPAIDAFSGAIPVYTPANNTRCKIYSTSTNQYEGAEQFTAGYWLRNLRQPVQFAGAVQSLAAENDILGIEISSHALLGTLAGQIAEGNEHKALWLNSCLKEQAEVQTFANALSHVYMAGVDINWDAWYDGVGSRQIKVPPYTYNKKEYWIGISVQNELPELQSAVGANDNSKYQLMEWPELLRSLIADITYLQPASIRTEDSFRDMGLDSLMILKLRRRIEEVKGVQVKTPVFWNYPNIRLLSAYLGTDKHISPSTGNIIMPAIMGIADSITDDEVNSALDKIIADTL